MISSCCFISKLSATIAFAPPGPSNLAMLTTKCANSRNTSFIVDRIRNVVTKNETIQTSDFRRLSVIHHAQEVIKAIANDVAMECTKYQSGKDMVAPQRVNLIQAMARCCWGEFNLAIESPNEPEFFQCLEHQG